MAMIPDTRGEARPFSSVLVPTFNQDKYIGAALDSLLAQTDPDWEAIVVDDGSTDGTADILRGYAERDSRFRVVHKSNGGVASALNAALELARGEWIHWLSSDDMFEPNKLAVNRTWIERHPSAGFFFSYFKLLRQNVASIENHDLWGPLPAAAQRILGLFYRNYISGISICVRHDVWDRIGPFDEKLRYAQDYDRWLHLLGATESVFIPEWLVVNRNHSEQGSEVFPDACYFDTATAALRFVNAHSFEQMVPHADLSDPVTARAAAEYALAVAADRSSFIYGLGVNPALLLRLLEWLYADPKLDAETITALKERIALRARAYATDEQRGPWTRMWGEISAALAEPAPRFAFAPVDALALTRQEFARRRANRAHNADPLQRYLERHEGVHESLVPPPGAGDGHVVVVTQAGRSLRAVVEAASALAERGTQTTIIDPSAATSYAWTPHAGVLRAAGRACDIFPWIGRADVVVALGETPPSPWLEGAARQTVPVMADATSLLTTVLDLLGRGEERKRRRVYLLERVLSGGGAERVVMEIVRNLDRRRYEPVLLTLFPDYSGTSCPPDVPVHCIQTYPEQPRPAPAPTVTVAEPVTTPPPTVVATASQAASLPFWRQILAVARRLYWRLTPSLRERLGLGAKARRLLRWLQRWRGAQPATVSIVTVAAPAPPPPPAPSQPPTWHPLGWTIVDTLGVHAVAGTLLARVLKTEGDGVIIPVMEEATVAAWFAQAQVEMPYISSLHTVESSYMRQLFADPLRHQAESWAFANACRQAQAVVFPSQGCGCDLVNSFAMHPQAVRTIHNPANLPRLRRLASMQPETPLAESEHFTFVMLARLSPEKNHQLLVRACALLLERRRDFRVLCLGDGIMRGQLENDIRWHGLHEHIHLLGEQSNPYPILARSDALILTSWFEAFALVLVEAMALEVPVISVDCPFGPAEVLTGPAGRGGLLVLENPRSLADGMELLMSDESTRKRLTQLGLERAQHFDASEVVRTWERLIDTTIPTPHDAMEPANAIHFPENQAAI
jgi:glycosyltransferase involved in cell wall biosynthesis